MQKLKKIEEKYVSSLNFMVKLMTSCFYIIYDIIPIHLPVIPAFMFMQINLKT